MTKPLIPCPTCNTADHLAPVDRPGTSIDKIAGVVPGPFGIPTTVTDRKAWTRCQRCGMLIRQRRGPIADVFARIFFGSRARPGEVIRPKR